MYSGRQRDLRERRAHQAMDAPGAFDQDGLRDPDDAPELETPGWSIQLNTRASAA
jgi:hypothetical protein